MFVAFVAIVFFNGTASEFIVESKACIIKNLSAIIL